MSFTTPLGLILLVALPVIWYIGFPRQRYRRRRDITSLLIRTVIVVLLVLALSGMQAVQAVDQLAVVYLVDASDSIDQPAREAQLAYIQESLAEKPSDDQAAVIVFGADAQVDRSFSTLAELDSIDSQVNATNTDLAGALSLAMGVFPADTARRIVILSDGQQTIGDAVSRAQLAAASDIEISYVPFFRAPAADVRVTDLIAPSRVFEGQEFDVTVSIEAEEATDAQLLIFSDGALIHESDIALQAGTTTYTLPQTSEGSGFLDFQARIVAPDGADDFRQNNELSAFSQVVGPPQVLLLATDPNEIVHLLPALDEAGLNVEVREPGQFLPELAELTAYKSVILANVPATALSNRQMDTLDRFVRDLGGGLVVVGGPESYGPGGYFDTPLEDTLPVEMQIRDQQRLPQLTIAYIIDRSGSMGVAGASGVPNIELAKEAIIRSVEFLQPTDRAAVAAFDSSAGYVVPFVQAIDRRRIQELIATLRSGGGTDILAGMSLIAEDIINEPSDRKHIILLTDGGASQDGLMELTRQLNQGADVTTSVVAVGDGAADFLDEMAEVGGGNFHFVALPEQIPTIFTLETVLATRSYIIEEPFTPLLAGTSPIMDGIRSAPALLGYVATSPKATAQVILRPSDEFPDPLLASWQYGLGRAVAFTSDATSRWAQNWVQWDEFTRFWGQAVSWTITESSNNNIETRVIMQGDEARIIVDARDDSGDFLNDLELVTTVSTPDGDSEIVVLDQAAPGRYEGAFSPDEEGAYYLALTGGGIVDGDNLGFNEINGWVMSYSPEYIQGDQDDTLLVELADLTGGANLEDDPALVFDHTLEVQMASAPLAPWLLLIAVLLLPLDIAVRRLVITRSDIARLRAYLSRERISDAVEEQQNRLSALRQARDRARQQTEAEEAATSTVAALKQRQSNPRPSDAETTTTAEPSKPRTPPKTTYERRKPEEGNIGARLLKRRKGEDDEGA